MSLIYVRIDLLLFSYNCRKLIAAAAYCPSDSSLCYCICHSVFASQCVCVCVAAKCLLSVFALAGKRLGGKLVSSALPLCANCVSSSGCVQNSMWTKSPH